MYDDEYQTCARTYATLLIYPKEMDPADVTELLQIEPSRIVRQGDELQPPGSPRRLATINVWFLGSQGHIESRDLRRHIDWILNKIATKGESLRALRSAGSEVVIFCYWCSAMGHGGPMITASQMKAMAEVDIDLWFDFYGPYDPEESLASPGPKIPGE